MWRIVKRATTGLVSAAEETLIANAAIMLIAIMTIRISMTTPGLGLQDLQDHGGTTTIKVSDCNIVKSMSLKVLSFF